MHRCDYDALQVCCYNCTRWIQNRLRVNKGRDIQRIAFVINCHMHDRYHRPILLCYENILLRAFFSVEEFSYYECVSVAFTED